MKEGKVRRQNDGPHVLQLTRRELDVVWTAMGSIRDDLDDVLMDGRDKAAFHRALDKMRRTGRYVH